MNRSTLRQFLWDLLGTKPTDPFYPTLRIDTMLNTAEGRLAEEARKQAPDMFRVTKTLAADGGAGNVYTLATQTPGIVDFHEVLSLRLANANGLRLRQVPDGEIEMFSGGFYSLTGNDANTVITTDAGIASATPLYFKYSRKLAAWPNPADSPESIPADFHDVIALNAAEMLFALGGESGVPDEIARWALDRRGAFWNHIGRRSGDPQIVRGEGQDGFIETVRR